jgi:phenylpropionate dioxygenase-like ring-hydroxylating dioxygenase large terminal subunit
MAIQTRDKELSPNYSPNRFLQRYGRMVGTGPVPIEPFISAEYFARERQTIFKRCWLNIGRVEQVPKPGDFFTKDLEVCDANVLVLRGRDGEVRAFHNVCQHRGNRLIWEPNGNCKSHISCRYHGWSYDTTGALARASDAENFWELRPESHHLVPIATDTWKGFIFINLSQEPSETLRQYLGELADLLEDYPFERLTTCFAYSVRERANWKIAATSQEEGYHVPYIHRQSHGRAIYADRQGNYRSLDIQLIGRHHRILTGPNPDFQPSIVEKIASSHMPGFVDAFAGDISSTQIERNRSIPGYYSIFPNFHMLALDGNYLAYNFWPLNVGETLWEIRAFYPEPKTIGQQFALEYGRCASRDIVSEDIPLHEAIQSSLRAGAISHFTFHDEEICCRHTMKVVDDYVNGGYA